MAYEPSTPFYIIRSEEQEGPVAYSDLRQLLSSGEVQPDHLCWTEGMAEWVTVASVLPVEGTPAPVLTLRSIEDIEQDTNPYAPPLSELRGDASKQREYSYGGMTRLPYFLVTMGLGVLQGVMAEKASPTVMLGVWVVYVVGVIYTTLSRIKNLGISRWWLLWAAVPVLNIVAGYRFMFCPEGWGDSRTLDKTGKVLLVLFLLLMALSIAAVVLLPDPAA